MGMISLIINGWELGALWLRKPPQISQISKVCWEMWNSQNGEHFDAKKSEPHPQKSMFKEICPQSSGNDRNWMLKHLKQLTLGDENKKNTQIPQIPTIFPHFLPVDTWWLEPKKNRLLSAHPFAAEIQLQPGGPVQVAMTGFFPDGNMIW